MISHDSNRRPPPDKLLVDIADYVADAAIESPRAYEAARLCLMDALGCALLALRQPACARLLGPTVPATVVPRGARVPGTHYELDPVQAAFNLGSLIRWLDLNDTWLAAEWGHPSDNLGAILACADFASRAHRDRGEAPLSMRDVLTAAIKAYELQGVLALENSFNRVGFDHVVLVKVASAAVATQILGGDKEQILNAVSNAWIDGHSLRVYRHAPNTGTRKSWASGDAAARGVWLALLALKGEMGYPSALTAKNWGVQEVLLRGKPLVVPRPFGSYVIENILFKVSFPAEFHGQTAVECALKLHPEVKDRLEDIERITLTTQEAARRIIDKTGPLDNSADRDHCLQYMVAVALIFGDLTARHYEDTVAADPRIDRLREKMVTAEDPRYSRDYLDPNKRSIANTVQLHFRDGTRTEKIEVEYPIGHPRRRTEAIPLLEKKFAAGLASAYPPERREEIARLLRDPSRLDATAVDKFMDLLVS